MKTSRLLLTLTAPLLVACLAIPSMAKETTPNTRPDAEGAARMAYDRLAQNARLDADFAAGTPLEKYLDRIKDYSDAQFIIVRDPGAPASINLPEIHLKQVSAASLVNLLPQLDGRIDVKWASDSGGNVWVVRLLAPSDGGFGGGGRGGFYQPQVKRVRAYRLSEAVAALNQKATTQPSDRESLNAILSVVKATVSAGGDESDPPTLYVHEATQTLIVRGNQAQIDAIASAVAAQVPPDTTAVLNARVEFLQQENDRLRKQLDAATHPH